MVSTPKGSGPKKAAAPKSSSTKSSTTSTPRANTPVMYQAVTKSYRLRHIMHAMRPDKKTTLCGRDILKGSKQPFDVEMEGACGKCIQSINAISLAHPGWEDAALRPKK